jgi:hypothetical protein
MTRENILPYVQKLRELAGNNPNPHEAAAAVLKARQLMEEAGLNESDVEFCRSEYVTCKRVWMRHLANACGNVNECLFLFARLPRGGTGQFIGRGVNPDIAFAMWHYLTEAILRAYPKGKASEYFFILSHIIKRLAPWIGSKRGILERMQAEYAALHRVKEHRGRKIHIRVESAKVRELQSIADKINLARQAHGPEFSVALLENNS